MKKNFLKSLFLIPIIGLLIGTGVILGSLDSENASVSEDPPDYVEANLSVMTWNVGDPEPFKNLNKEAVFNIFHNVLIPIHPNIAAFQEDFMKDVYYELSMNHEGLYIFKIKPTNADFSLYGNGLTIFSDFRYTYPYDTITWWCCFSDNCGGRKGFTKADIYMPPLDNWHYQVHFYDLHAEAHRLPENHQCREWQFEQLSDYMNEKSAGKAVIVVGDYNLDFHDGWDRDILYDFMDAQGLQSSCPLGTPTTDGGVQYDYILYRSSDDVILTEQDCNVLYNEGAGISDHFPVIANFNVKLLCGPLPDLQITHLWFETTNSSATPNTVYATIKNVGPVATPSVDPIITEIEVDGIEWGSFEVVDENEWHRPLASGESYTGKVIASDDPIPTTDASHNIARTAGDGTLSVIKAVVDPDNRVAEIDDTNNTLEKSAPMRYISLENPMEGEYTIEDTIHINWTFSGLSGYIDIKLLKVGYSECLIATCPISNRSYSWVVNDCGYGEGSDFKILISTEDGQYSDHSNFLTLTCVPEIKVYENDPQYLIKDFYNYGDTIKIKYDTKCINSNIRFVLRRITSGGVLLENYTLGYGVPGYQNKRTFTIPYGCVSPGLCNIKAKAEGIYVLTKRFTIGDPEIKILKLLPVDKSTFKSGDTIKIQWEAKGISETMRVVLRRITSSGILIEDTTIGYKDPVLNDNTVVYQMPYTIRSTDKAGLYNIKVKAQGVYDLTRRFNVQ
jgi:hypothetical protein